MDDPKFRDFLQSFCDLPTKANNFFFGKGALCQPLFEGDTGDEFHNQEINTILSIKIVDVGNISVAQP